MLACVSTLRNITSYESVRDGKAWLTTNEAVAYIKEHCPALNDWLNRSQDSRYHSNYDFVYDQLIYNRLYSMTVEADSIHWRLHEPMVVKKVQKKGKIVSRKVRDNGRRPVRFYNRETIMAAEFFYKNKKEEEEQRVKEWQARFQRECCLSNIEASKRARLSSNYNEFIVSENKTSHGSFYDPEWF
jgi:hypothetical protein